MTVKSISSSDNTRSGKPVQRSVKGKYNPQFTSGFNPVVAASDAVITVTDAISRGGFAASFIAQDGIGMVAPRIWEGLNRGRKREKDPVTGEETGKKIGPYNWTFARREGIREILSGPSAFLIPAMIMAGIKKYSGRANNVPINMINTFGEKFHDSLIKNKDFIKDLTDLKDAKQTLPIKFDLYKQMFEATLRASLDNAPSINYDVQAEKMANKLLEIESAKSKGFWKHFIGKKTPGMREDLTSELVGEFMDLRKSIVSPTKNELEATIKVNWRENPVSVSFNKMLGNMIDYTDDVIKSAHNYLKKDSAKDFDKFLKSFNIRRSGSRFLSNFAMFFAVVGFYDVIPKLYNMGIKNNPDEVGVSQETAEEAKTENKKETDKKADDKKAKDVPFTGAMSAVNENAGKIVLKGGWLKKLSDTFEFDGASMSVPAMLTLLFGFCLPPRLRDAKGEHDRREILVRDIASFTAILFGAKALSRMFSTAFAKLSGLALNVKPKDHDKGFIYKLKNYVTAGKGVNVLGSDQLASKHSNLKQYKDGILGYIEFLNKTGGDPRKVFRMDKEVKEAAENILGGKKLKEVTMDELIQKFRVAKEQNSSELDKIYKAFESPDNKFVRIAKTLNSSFEFASIIFLVPAFMIWLARYCERMTKENKEKQRLAEEAAKNNQTVSAMSAQQINQNRLTAAKAAAQPTMAGFLNR